MPPSSILARTFRFLQTPLITTFSVALWKLASTIWLRAISVISPSLIFAELALYPHDPSGKFFKRL